MTTLLGQSPPPAASTAPSRSEALAADLAHAGFSACVRIGADPLALPPDGAAPRFALHLPRPIPLDQLLYGLCALRAARAQALLLTAERSGRSGYRERLQLDDTGRVRAIARDFSGATNPARRHPRFLAALWQIDGAYASLPAPVEGHAWLSARALLRINRRALLRFPADAAAASYFVGPPAAPRRVYDTVKRCADIAFALFAVTVTLPICLVVALAIKLYDRGPVFFSHTREGLNGRPFGCIKFRTMIRNADAQQATLRAKNNVDGPQFKLAWDPRITPIGHFLRKTNIDELPQFLNVLVGQMSVVGPRPSPFKENQLCPPWREARLSVKPGITGLWQVSRSRTRGAADFQEWIMYDTQYVEKRSFRLDLKILLLTLKELFGKGQ